MRVMVFVKATADSEAGKMPPAALFEAMGRYNEELAAAGILETCAGLKPSSAAARVTFSGSSRSVTDGPFTETKELAAGFWIWNVASMEEAIAWVRRCPNPMMTDSDIDIRPFYELEDLQEVLTPEARVPQENAMSAANSR